MFPVGRAVVVVVVSVCVKRRGAAYDAALEVGDEVAALSGGEEGPAWMVEEACERGWPVRVHGAGVA